MINLLSRRKYFRFSIIRWLVTAICSLPTVLYTFYCLLIGFVQKGSSFVLNQNILLFCSIPFFVVNLFFIFFNGFYRKKINKTLFYEFCEIVSLQKLPKNLPKVVYVYTCHNDIYPARVLQNAKQTYKNMEIWISEGSENLQVVQKTKEFAQKYNFNFFAVGGSGSSNKADNLNSFLARSGATFDYLLITDSDEALHEDFVSQAIKCFYWKNFHNLGFVSARNFSYLTNNLFSNTLIWSDTKQFEEALNSMYVHNKYVDLYSASALISKELLNVSDGKFPDGCLEDVFLASISLRNSFTGIVLPTTPSGQAFDKSIKAWHNRTLRIFDWIVYLVKKDKVNKYNEKYTAWFREYLSTILYPFRKIVSWFTVSIIIWILCYNSSFIFNNAFLTTTIIYTIIAAISVFISRNFIEWKIDGYKKKTLPLYIILLPLMFLAEIPYCLHHWFKAFILGKYSAFGGSGQKSKSKNSIFNIRWDLFFLCLFTILLSGWTLIFSNIIGFNNVGLGFLYILFTILFSLGILSFLSEIILFLIGLIPNNKTYSRDDFINAPKATQYLEVKQQFIADHKNDSRYDLSVLK